MIPAAFEYVRARSVAHARELLEEHGDDAKLLAGGHSLIPMMKLRLAQPKVVIDIGRIPGLDAIDAAGDPIAIGALTRHAALAGSDELRRCAPVLWDAANELGDAQVRNRGTVGGACAHGDPAADYPAVMLALAAEFTIEGDRRHTADADAFFRGMFETALGPGEVLTAIGFRPAPVSAYVKLHHPASHYAVAGAAARLEVEGERIVSARIGLTGVGFSAYRPEHVERALAGLDIRDAAGIALACRGAAEGIDLRSDPYASAEYRAAMAGVVAARAVGRALSRS